MTSTLHRVRRPPLKGSGSGGNDEYETMHRYSIPYFIIPKRDTFMEPLQGTFNKGKEPNFEPTAYGDFHAMKIASVFKE